MAGKGETPPSNDGSPIDVRQTPYAPGRVYRQLYPQRQPLYIPAALRPTNFASHPTDIPNRPRAPDTPPASKDNSFDSLKSNPSALTNVTLPHSGSAQQQNEFMRGFDQTFTEGLEANLEEVTGPPTKAHWKPDKSGPKCAACLSTFTWLFRRHHCRHCGNIFCDDHSKKEVPLDHNARYHPHGEKSRACDACYMQWKEIKKLRHSRASSMANSLTISPEPSAEAQQIPKKKKPSTVEDHGGSSMARSEGGMVWSTF